MADKSKEIPQGVSDALAELLDDVTKNVDDANSGHVDEDQATTLPAPLLEGIQEVGATFDAIDEECRSLAQLAGTKSTFEEHDVHSELPVEEPRLERDVHSPEVRVGKNGNGTEEEREKNDAEDSRMSRPVVLDVFMDEEGSRLEEAQRLVHRLQREKAQRRKRMESAQAKATHRVMEKRRREEADEEHSRRTLEEERRRAQQERQKREAEKRAERRRALEKNLSRCIRKKLRLHEKMAAGFQHSFELKRQEQRRKKLESIKAMHQLPRREEIMAHQQWYHQNVRKIQKKKPPVSITPQPPLSTRDAINLRRRLEYGKQVRCLHKPTRFKPFRKPIPPTEPRRARQRSGDSRGIRTTSSTALVVHESVQQGEGTRHGTSMKETTDVDVAEMERRTVSKLQRLNAQIEHLHGHELKQAVATVDKISKVYVKRLQSKIAEYQKLVTQ